jgi:hypothetical protein
MAVPPTLLAAPVFRSRTPACDMTPVKETLGRAPGAEGGRSERPAAQVANCPPAE